MIMFNKIQVMTTTAVSILILIVVGKVTGTTRYLVGGTMKAVAVGMTAIITMMFETTF